MTLDDQLRRTMASLTDRLREEAERHLAAITAEFAETIRSERAAAAAEASAEARAAANRELAERLTAAAAAAAAHERDAVTAAVAAAVARVEDGRLRGQQEAAKAARDAAFAECRTAELAANERLLEAIRAIDAAGSLTEVLETLASSAGREAARVAVLLVRGGALRGWRFIGFGGPLEEQRNFAVPSADAGIIAEAARTGIAVSANSTPTRSAPAFAALPPGREVLAVPVQMRGQVIAVLYADQGVDQTGANVVGPVTLEVLARHAARSLESITAFRAAQVLTGWPDIASNRVHRAPGAPGEMGEHVETARRDGLLPVSDTTRRGKIDSLVERSNSSDPGR